MIPGFVFSKEELSRSVINSAANTDGVKPIRIDISKEIIDKVFPEERLAVQENMLAEKLVFKKLERIKSLPYLEQKKKLYEEKNGELNEIS